MKNDGFVYVCMEDDENWGKIPVCSFPSEEKAMSWLKRKFAAWKKKTNYDVSSGDVIREHFTKDDGYPIEEQWLCYHQWENTIGWYVYKVSARK